MYVPPYDRIQIDGELFNILSPAPDEEPEGLVDARADDLPGAWWCAVCGTRHFECLFGLVDDRLHLLELVLRADMEKIAAIPGWLPSAEPRGNVGAVVFRGMLRPSPFSGTILAANGRLNLNGRDNERETCTYYRRVLSLEFEMGVLRSRDDVSDVAAQDREELQLEDADEA